MKSLIVIVTIVICSICNCTGQVSADYSADLNNDSVYTHVLENHVRNLENTSRIAKLLDDSVIRVIKTYPITNVLPSNIGKRRIHLIDYSEIDSLSKKGGFNAIEIRPMYFKNNEIHIIVSDLSVKPNNNKHYILQMGYSLFVYSFNCSTSKFELIQVRH